MNDIRTATGSYDQSNLVFAEDPGETFLLMPSDVLSKNGPFEEPKAGERGVSGHCVLCQG